MATAALMDELIEEVFLRLPPSEPASLVRAAAVCKRWYTIISDPGFRRRFREFHRAPPTIGIVYNVVDGDTYVARFRPCAAAAAFPSRADRRSSTVVDCRHGRVLLCDVSPVVGGEDLGTMYASALCVWNPVAGDQWEVPLPDHASIYSNKLFGFVVLCAAANDTCNHHGCHGGPFGIVIVGNDDQHNIFIYNYSSEAAASREPSSIQLDTTLNSYSKIRSGLVVAGDAVYFILDKDGHKILRYDLSGHAISVITPPPLLLGEGTVTRLVAAKDGGLGIANVENYNLHVWSWRAAGGSNGVGQWVKDQVIKLDMVLSIATDEPLTRFIVFDFGEGTDIIFISSNAGYFVVWLKFGRIMKVDDKSLILAPMGCYQSFCTPALGAAPCMSSFPASQSTEVSIKREENVTPQVLESQSSGLDQDGAQISQSPSAFSILRRLSRFLKSKLRKQQPKLEGKEGLGFRQRMQRS